MNKKFVISLKFRISISYLCCRFRLRGTRQKVTTYSNHHQDPWRHMTSLGHSELIRTNVLNKYIHGYVFYHVVFLRLTCLLGSRSTVTISEITLTWHHSSWPVIHGALGVLSLINGHMWQAYRLCWLPNMLASVYCVKFILYILPRFVALRFHAVISLFFGHVLQDYFHRSILSCSEQNHKTTFGSFVRARLRKMFMMIFRWTSYIATIP